jgi:hypothetical protein
MKTLFCASTAMPSGIEERTGLVRRGGDGEKAILRELAQFQPRHPKRLGVVAQASALSETRLQDFVKIRYQQQDTET